MYQCPPLNNRQSIKVVPPCASNEDENVLDGTDKELVHVLFLNAVDCLNEERNPPALDLEDVIDR